MIYTITGENFQERKQEVDAIKEKFARDHGSLAIERYDGTETEESTIIDALQSLPFLSSARLIIVDNFAAAKNIVKDIEQIISSIPRTNTVVLTDTKLDNRANYVKKFKDLTVFKNLTNKSGTGLSDWLVNYVSSSGGTISFGDANYLIGRVGANQDQLKNELDKLILYKPNISKTTINELCEPIPQSSIFELVDAAFTGDINKMFRLYEEQRAQKIEPLSILGMVAWQLHVLVVVKSAEKAGFKDTAKTTKLSPFVVSKAKRLVHRTDHRSLKNLLAKTYRLDILLKSQSLNSDDALKHYLLTDVATL